MTLFEHASAFFSELKARVGSPPPAFFITLRKAWGYVLAIAGGVATLGETTTWLPVWLVRASEILVAIAGTGIAHTVLPNKHPADPEEGL